ncbi:MAG: hypothetical protein WDZ51_07300 [Pirellulaceae bacterium]
MFSLRGMSSRGDGQPIRLRRPGGKVTQEPEVEGFLVEIITRPASPLSNRVSYGFRIDGGSPMMSQYRAGFATMNAARQAAKYAVADLQRKYPAEGQETGPRIDSVKSLAKQRMIRRDLKKKEKG